MKKNNLKQHNIIDIMRSYGIYGSKFSSQYAVLSG